MVKKFKGKSLLSSLNLNAYHIIALMNSANCFVIGYQHLQNNAQLKKMKIIQAHNQ